MNLVLLLHFPNQTNSTDIFNEDKSKNKAFLGTYSILLTLKFYSLPSAYWHQTYSQVFTCCLGCFVIEDYHWAAEFFSLKVFLECNRGNSTTTNSTVVPHSVKVWIGGKVESFHSNLQDQSLTVPVSFNRLSPEFFPESKNYVLFLPVFLLSLPATDDSNRWPNLACWSSILINSIVLASIN